jgi:hypothetical protein
MSRLLGLALLATLASSGCSDLICGPGTQRQQLANGHLACVPTAVQPGDVHCDADAGVQLVGGDNCVSVVQCGPGTMLDTSTGTCVSSGGPMPHVPDACPAPSAGNLCITGVVRHFVDSSFLSGEMVRVAVYDPLAFLGNPSSTPIAEVVTGDTYLFKDVKTPGTGLVALAVTDPAGATAIYQITGVGAVVVAGQSYRLDAFAVKKSDVQAWSTSSGVDYDAQGAYVGRFFQDAVTAPNNLPATETMPLAGVKMVEASSGMPPAGTQYFSTNLLTVGPSLTVTSAVGGAIAPTPSLNTFSGSGGGVAMWEAFNGSSIAHAVFIQRFHPHP